MKKLMFIVVSLLSTNLLSADTAVPNSLWDQIQLAFVGNAKTAIEFTTHGQTQYEFLDNFIEVGKLHGSPIAAIDIGLLGTQLPDSTVQAVDWANGVKLHLSPILKYWVTVQPEWQFINNLEIDARYSYNYTRHHPTAGISVAYPFK